MMQFEEDGDWCHKCDINFLNCECAINAFVESLLEERTEYVEDRLTGTLYEQKFKVMKEEINK